MTEKHHNNRDTQNNRDSQNQYNHSSQDNGILTRGKGSASNAGDARNGGSTNGRGHTGEDLYDQHNKNNSNNNKNKNTKNNKNNGIYDNNPLLDLFESSGGGTVPFSEDLDYDHPMHTHGQTDTQGQGNGRTNARTNGQTHGHANGQKSGLDRNVSPFPWDTDTRDTQRDPRDAVRDRSLTPQWVEEMVFKPLSAVQVAAANIPLYDLESLGLGSWLEGKEWREGKKGADGYRFHDYQAMRGEGEDNPLLCGGVEGAAAMQSEIRRRYSYSYYIDYLLSSLMTSYLLLIFFVASPSDLP